MASEKARLISEIFRPARRRFPRRQTVIKSLNDLMQLDLCDFQAVSKENNNFRFLLTGVNAFSKYGYALPIKNKTAQEVANAAEIILDDSKRLIGREIKHIQVDEGTEFKGAFARMCARRNIKKYSTSSALKATLVERFNKTLKIALYKRMASLASLKYIKFLPEVLRKYNETPHSKTGMTPLEASKARHESFLQKHVYKNRRKRIIAKFAVGDWVRVSTPKFIFSRSFHPQYSPRLYQVHMVNAKEPATYILKDHRGEIVKGTFYEQELQKTRDPNLFLVEKVLQRRANSVKVRWLGYNSEDDTWIPKDSFITDQAE